MTEKAKKVKPRTTHLLPGTGQTSSKEKRLESLKSPAGRELRPEKKVAPVEAVEEAVVPPSGTAKVKSRRKKTLSLAEAAPPPIEPFLLKAAGTDRTKPPARTIPLRKINGQASAVATLKIAPETILQLEKLTKRFGKRVANDAISLKIRRGERIGILGANGAGKTTLVEQIVGLTRPTEGAIVYNFDFKRVPQEKMGMQFQGTSYPDGISVKDVIDFSLEIYKKRMTKDQLKRLLSIFQMEGIYKLPAKFMSGGQQQKLNVLLAILHDPEILILDEISTGLDVLAREQIIQFLEKIVFEKRMTLLLISHHMSEIETMCERAIVLSKGRVTIDSPIVEIKSKYGSLEAMMRETIDAEIRSGATNEPPVVRRFFRWKVARDGKR